MVSKLGGEQLGGELSGGEAGSTAFSGNGTGLTFMTHGTAFKTEDYSAPPDFNTLDFNMEKALDFFMDPVSGSNAQGKTVVGIVNIHVDDVLMTFAPGAKAEMIKLLSKHFQI